MREAQNKKKRLMREAEETMSNTQVEMEKLRGVKKRQSK